MSDTPTPAPTSLSERDGLPDAMRSLVKEYPRNGWERNANYSHLIAFWLDRHLMFRKLLDQLDNDVKAALDGNDAQDSYKRKLSRFGGMLINQLHGHHQIEDHFRKQTLEAHRFLGVHCVWPPLGPPIHRSVVD